MGFIIWTSLSQFSTFLVKNEVILNDVFFSSSLFLSFLFHFSFVSLSVFFRLSFAFRCVAIYPLESFYFLPYHRRMEKFLCVLSNEIPKDPIVGVPSGKIYSKKAFIDYLSGKVKNKESDEPFSEPILIDQEIISDREYVEVEGVTEICRSYRNNFFRINQ